MRKIRTTLAMTVVAAIVTTGAAAPATAQEPDIVQTAAAAGSFKTLTKLAKRAGLVPALKARGPYTVFAPTDAAFAKVPERKLNALLRSKAKLRAVLLYHVAAGRLEAADVVERSAIKTLNGAKVRVRVDEGDVFVNRAQVTTPDVMASNGVIHVVDRVLMPPAR
jgi:uncharacterized surface protein with fasciclin (FAS1) repeats